MFKRVVLVAAVAVLFQVVAFQVHQPTVANVTDFEQPRLYGPMASVSEFEHPRLYEPIASASDIEIPSLYPPAA